MLGEFFNWRSLLAVIAIAIVSGTVFYSNYLGRKIAREERQKVEEWVEASNALLSATAGDTRLPFKIIQDNDDVPVIWTNEQDSIVQYINLDSQKIAIDTGYVRKKLDEFRAINDPIKWTDPYDSTRFNLYYFGHTRLLNEVRYYPLVQLLIVALFIIITLLALQSRNRSVQNMLWTGMAKETAHQLGTPVSSMQGWVEMLKEQEGAGQIAAEMEKDVERLKLVSDRFGKIGSVPQLEPHNTVEQVQRMVDYVKKRAAGKVQFHFIHERDAMVAPLSPPLFDWVIENLLKNALDAMDGNGSITVTLKEEAGKVLIDVADTGKGIASQNINRVFKPGFTTKKRGWGLGLSLSKRIIEQYHKGKLFVKHSEVGKGTTFRIELKK
ncbi:HAMP domain-containing sensor histidine kinase [Lacibacter sp. MH-610]|uniref:sensor histidine kinase n=1 Tax=Lacibacter sp. MH-610 TaxID=3020883 RepID=UPI0038919710